jgi:hypothetical protein
VNRDRFWRAAAVQGAQVGVLFVVLALALDEDFFDDYGWFVGPVSWVVASLVSGRVLGLPVTYTLFCAAAGAVAGLIVELAGPHWAAVIAGVGVFAASAAGYDEQAGAGDAPGQASTP